MAEIILNIQCLEKRDVRLNRELIEYQENESWEGLTDLLEVVQETAKVRGWTWEQLEQMRQAKAAQRGGFEKKILLKEVIEK